MKHDEDGVEVWDLVVGEAEEGWISGQPSKAEVESSEHEALALQ